MLRCLCWTIGLALGLLCGSEAYADPPAHLHDAVVQGKVSVEATALGGSTGDTIQVAVKRLGKESLRLDLASGTVFRSVSGTVQDMAGSRVRGERAAASSYTVASEMSLSDDQVHTYVIEAFCLDFHKANPGAGDKFRMEAPTPETTTFMTAGVASGRSIEQIQAALWMRRDGIGDAELAARFPVGAADLKAARGWLKSLGSPGPNPPAPLPAPSSPPKATGADVGPSVATRLKSSSGVKASYELVRSTDASAPTRVSSLQVPAEAASVRAEFGEPQMVEGQARTFFPTPMPDTRTGEVWAYGSVRLFVRDGKVLHVGEGAPSAAVPMPPSQAAPPAGSPPAAPNPPSATIGAPTTWSDRGDPELVECVATSVLAKALAGHEGTEVSDEGLYCIGGIPIEPASVRLACALFSMHSKVDDTSLVKIGAMDLAIGREELATPEWIKVVVESAYLNAVLMNNVTSLVVKDLGARYTGNRVNIDFITALANRARTIASIGANIERQIPSLQADFDAMKKIVAEMLSKNPKQMAALRERRIFSGEQEAWTKLKTALDEARSADASPAADGGFSIRSRFFENLKVSAKAGIFLTFDVLGGKLSIGGDSLEDIGDPFRYGIEHRYMNDVQMDFGGERYVIHGARSEPIVFMAVRDKGYVYVRGRGSVTLPDGTTVQLPR